MITIEINSTHLMLSSNYTIRSTITITIANYYPFYDCATQFQMSDIWELKQLKKKKKT